MITLNYFSCCVKPKPRAGKMTQWIHVLIAKPDDMGSISRAHMRGQSQLKKKLKSPSSRTSTSKYTQWHVPPTNKSVKEKAKPKSKSNQSI